MNLNRLYHISEVRAKKAYLLHDFTDFKLYKLNLICIVRNKISSCLETEQEVEIRTYKLVECALGLMFSLAL